MAGSLDGGIDCEGTGKRPDDMAPRDIDGLGKLAVGYFSKADFHTCLSMLNKFMT